MKRYILILVSLLALGLEAQSQKHTISGYVQDAASGEQLLGVNVIWQDQLQGTTTNTYGFYSLTLPEGEVEIVFSYIGFDKVVKKSTCRMTLP